MGMYLSGVMSNRHMREGRVSIADGLQISSNIGQKMCACR